LNFEMRGFDVRRNATILFVAPSSIRRASHRYLQEIRRG